MTWEWIWLINYDKGGYFWWWYENWIFTYGIWSKSIVAYMIGCGDTLPWNYLSLLIFKPNFRALFRSKLPQYPWLILARLISFLVFDPTLYTISGSWDYKFIWPESLPRSYSHIKLAPLPGRLKLSCYTSLTGFLGVLHPFLCYLVCFVLFCFVLF